MYHFDFGVLANAFPFILRGAPATVWVSVASLCIGVAIGLPIGVLRISPSALLNAVLSAYVEVFRNTPILVQIVWFYYVLPIYMHVNLSAMTAGIVALGLNASANLAEVFRGGIVAIASGQSEASASLGFTHVRTLRYVVLPQVARRMLVPFLNQFIVLIKDSALVAYIGVLDLMHRGDIYTAQYARPLEVYTVVAIIYFVMCFGVSKLARWMEVRFAFPE